MSSASERTDSTPEDGDEVSSICAGQWVENGGATGSFVGVHNNGRTVKLLVGKRGGRHQRLGSKKQEIDDNPALAAERPQSEDSLTESEGK